MSYYLETVKRKSGVRYRIVRDMVREGKRNRTYHTLPAGTTKDTAKKICCEMNLNADFGDFLQKKSMILKTMWRKFISPNTHCIYPQRPRKHTDRCIRPMTAYVIVWDIILLQK